MQHAVLLVVVVMLVQLPGLVHNFHLDVGDLYSPGSSGALARVPASRRKVWTKYDLLSMPSNWEGGSVPCSGDKVVFPWDMRGTTAYLPNERTLSFPFVVRELVLPFHGSLSMGFFSNLVIGGAASRTRACRGRDVRWRTTGPPSWLDPDNWRPPDRADDPVAGGDKDLESKDLEAVPHLERIPCGQDVAVFRSGAFRVLSPDYPVRVAAVLFADGPLQTLITGRNLWMLTMLQDKIVDTGRRWLPNTMLSIQLRARDAVDIPGLGEECGLGPSREAQGDGWQDQRAAEDLLHAVCQHVTCPVPACVAPVRPHLHCCYVCGAVVELRPLPSGEVLDELRRTVHAAALEYEESWGAGTGPGVHVGAVPSPSGGPGLGQIVLLGDNAEDLARIILARIKEDSDNAHMSVLTPSLIVSGVSMAPASVGSVLSVVLGSLMLVLVALAVIVYLQDGALPVPSRLADLFNNEKHPSFIFARFENTADEEPGAVVNVAGRPKQPGVRSARGSWSARSFRNPLYDQEQPDGDVPPLALRPSARGTAHENPLFSELQGRLDQGLVQGLDGLGHQGLHQGDDVKVQDQNHHRLQEVDPASAPDAEDPTLGVKLVDITL